MQLHRVIAAERSAVVAEEDQHCRPLLPRVGEANLVPAQVLEHEARKVARVIGPAHLLTLPRGSEHD
jgi:hypothetical protein